MQGLVTVFGGSGFVGGQVVRALAKAGHRVRVAVRNPNLAYRMRMLGDVGQIEVVQANVRNAPSVARAVDGAEAVVNLVGVLWESGRQKFQTLHVMGAKTVAEQAKAAGVKRLVQISAIGADANSPSKYQRTKAEGEAAVRAAFPGAVVIRPSIVFGAEDKFFNKFGQMAALFPALPLIGGGETKFQPVYVGDVAQVVAKAVAHPAAEGLTYELGGPAVYSFKEILEFILRETGRNRVLAPIPFFAAGLIGKIGDLSPIAPPLTSDQVESLKTDNVADHGLPGLAEAGVVPTTVESVVPSYLYRYRKGGQYAEVPAGAF
ncbi:3-beta hydroxysteroid dehydrogenase [Caulobacter sp. Root1455]|uniref:complex I NDUFA9 subunit family protein n=1 Tax=unclassified Caulobacter TaxID=2648921 RepID=UPI0006FBCB16|nr:MULTISPECIES: complex I NDUFA9 subunit family protein [unclassified Caulobacter]KQY35246.1 3-beta hydroxysteroid dehydrogenase [Caulobacter sp. Root487D2Y]KQY93222.1 3-beta hydroxysteroid dehydrogenase [Caulobacter sp. Root1455]